MRSKVRVPAKPNPMVDSFAIENAISYRGYTLAGFAELIDMSRHTLRMRLRDGRWTVLEAWRVCNILRIDFNKVFFAFPERVPDLSLKSLKEAS